MPLISCIKNLCSWGMHEVDRCVQGSSVSFCLVAAGGRTYIDECA